MTTNGQEIPREVIVKRLKKIEGQVRGLQKMLTDGRDCESIVTQLAAVRSALDSVGQLVLNNYMHICFLKEANIEDTAESLARVVAIWSRVHVGDKKSKS
ncbi:MAG TPA: metal-sensitive transcriptional regulator [Dehalococcoidia bacterium]|nr:metal-sensitive transcriptional regulator [Dehalococcoidia bacterium]